MKNDNQTMDRQIPVSEQRKRKIRKAVIGVAVAVAVLSIGAWLGSQMMPTLDRKALVISEVDRGTIDVSVSATELLSQWIIVFRWSDKLEMTKGVAYAFLVDGGGHEVCRSL